MSDPYKLCLKIPEELVKALRRRGRDLTLTERVIEALVAYLGDDCPEGFPTLDERRAANRERLRRTALARWQKKEVQDDQH